METPKILMVCLGNICRSPLAQGILKNKVSSKIIVDSAGTAGYHIGNSPDPRSIQIGKQNGIKISQYLARKFTKEDFKNFNHIYVMDKSNYADVLTLTNSQEDKEKVSLIHPYDQEIPDPYHGNFEAFEECYLLLDYSCEQIVKDLSLRT